MVTDIAFAIYNPKTQLFHAATSQEDWTTSIRKAYLYKHFDTCLTKAEMLSSRVVRVIMHSDMVLL